MPKPQRLQLLPGEEALLDQIDFNQPVGDSKAAGLLMQSLMARSGIPQERLQWWTDPEFNLGSGKSREEAFGGDGVVDMDIWTHAAFLATLKYFVFGPDLPDEVIDEFCEYVDSHRITGSTADELTKLAKDATRRYRLWGFEACEEFWKLANDCGVERMYGRRIRDAVRKVKTR